MNRDEIIKLAQEAGWEMGDDLSDGFGVRLERFAELVAAAERGKHKCWQGLTEEEVEYPHPPAKPPVYATSQNTKAVRDGFVMGGYEKEPGYYSEEQLDEFARAIEAALKEKNT